MATNIAELRKQSNLPAKQMGGGNVAAFFEANKASITAVLPQHMGPDRLMKVALHAIRTTPALLECTTKSLMGAVIQCAQLGLEPNTVLGHAYLVPFNNKKARRMDVQVIVGYKGLIDLARRSGQIESIAAHAVHENDEFECSLGTEDTLIHKPNMTKDRGKIIAFYAVAKLKGGAHAFEVMSKADVDKVMAGTQSKGAYGPWKDHYPEMGRKTVIRRLAKYLPLSIEFATAAALDSMADAGKDQGMDGALDGDFTILPDDAPAPETETKVTDVPENPENVDKETGEILDAPREETASQAVSEGPSIKDAMQAVEDKEFDLARDIARALSDEDRRKVEAEIAKAQRPATSSRRQQAMDLE
jgi:recombination protein RecT